MLKEEQKTSANAAYREYAKKHGANALSFKEWLLKQKTDGNVGADGSIKYFNVDAGVKSHGGNVDLETKEVDANAVTDNNILPTPKFKWLGMNPWIGIPLTAAVLYGAYRAYKHFKK